MVSLRQQQLVDLLNNLAPSGVVFRGRDNPQQDVIELYATLTINSAMQISNEYLFNHLNELDKVAAEVAPILERHILTEIQKQWGTRRGCESPEQQNPCP